MKSVPYVCEKPCGHADDHVGGCGGRLSPRHFQLGKNLLPLLSLGERDLFILINFNSYHILFNSLVNYRNINQMNPSLNVLASFRFKGWFMFLLFLG